MIVKYNLWSRFFFTKYFTSKDALFHKDIDLYNLKPGDASDIVVQSGDSLSIPEIRNGVTVFGEIFYPGTIMHERGKSTDYYINGCGGFTDFANPDKILILRANGKIDKKSWFTGSINPGDYIYITSKPIELVQYQKPFDWNIFWDSFTKATTTFTQSVTSVVTLYLLVKTINASK